MKNRWRDGVQLEAALRGRQPTLDNRGPEVAFGWLEAPPSSIFNGNEVISNRCVSVGLAHRLHQATMGLVLTSGIATSSDRVAGKKGSRWTSAS